MKTNTNLALTFFAAARGAERPQPFEHWRQILRRCSGSDTHANPEDRSHAESSAHARTAPVTSHAIENF